jgi:hypothetical protein
MSNLAGIVCELLERQQGDEPFDNVRIYRLLYLVDWKSSLSHGDGLTGIEWINGESSSLLGKMPTRSAKVIRALNGIDKRHTYRQALEVFRASVDKVGSLSDDAMETVEFVAKHTAGRSWLELDRLVFSTWPLLAGPRDAGLDLGELATAYKANASEDFATA